MMYNIFQKKKKNTSQTRLKEYNYSFIHTKTAPTVTNCKATQLIWPKAEEIREA